MKSTTFAVLAAYAITGSVAQSQTVVSFYTDQNQCNIRTGGFVTVAGGSGCIPLNTPGDTASVGAGHAGPASCITYFSSATCNTAEGFSTPIYLGSSSNSNNNLECSTGDVNGASFVPQAVSITDDTSACKPNTINVTPYAGAGCIAYLNGEGCTMAGAPDGKSVRCTDISGAASFTFSQTASRTDYVSYGFTDPDCAGDPGAGPYSPGTCGMLSNLACVRVTDRDDNTYIQQVGESYDTSEGVDP